MSWARVCSSACRSQQRWASSSFRETSPSLKGWADDEKRRPRKHRLRRYHQLNLRPLQHLRQYMQRLKREEVSTDETTNGCAAGGFAYSNFCARSEVRTTESGDTDCFPRRYSA